MSTLSLNCLLLGDSNDPEKIFTVEIEKNKNVSILKDMIKGKKSNSLSDVDASDLVLLKVSVPLGHVNGPLRIPKPETCTKFSPPYKKLSLFFSDPVLPMYLHVLVQNPLAASPQHPSKRRRLDSEPATKIQVEKPNFSRAPLTLKETEANMATAFAGFEDYIEYLATGKLDGYLDSIRREDKITDLNVDLNLDTTLLLHDIGKHVDQEQIQRFFIRDTVHLLSVSHSGKSRLLLDGLCHTWGLYISCRTNQGLTFGSDDFTVATEILQSMSTWHKGESSEPSIYHKNARAADHAFTMLLCARTFILKQLVLHLPVSTDVTVARRRWVLAQVLPPRLKTESDDLFVKVLRALRRADVYTMQGIIDSTLRILLTTRRDLFPKEIYTTLYVVIDDAEVAAHYLKDSTTRTDLRPIFREMYRFFDSRIFHGIMISGTALSMKIENRPWAGSAAYCERLKRPLVITDIGRFTRDDPSQVAYIRQYLALSYDDISDRRLLERMVYWFSGRRRLTASLIELFLHAEKVPRHRVLTAFAERLTGFKLTDAIELEDGEPNISPELSQKIRRYQPICELDHLFEEQNREELKQCLVNILMQWTLGNQATSIPIKHDMHDIIASGIGFLDETTSIWDFEPDVNYPAYISEPLVVLSLRSLFAKQSWTTRQTWMIKSLGNPGNNSSLGFVVEEAALFVLMEIFGGKFKAFADAFHCNRSFGSRKVTLVSLKRGPDGVMHSCPVSWNTGSSDCFGLKAGSPADVLAFLHNPDGKAFLFPDTQMRPDLLCFLQDEETKELIFLALQARVSPNPDAQTWQSALDSLTPQFFYTVVDGGRTQERYAPVSYPNLVNDLTETLEMILGPEVFTPILADTYRSKFHSCSTHHQQSTSALHSTRQTPRILRVIATPDDEQQKRLEGEWKGGGDVAFLRWDVMKDYLGSTADLMKTTAGVAV